MKEQAGRRSGALGRPGREILFAQFGELCLQRADHIGTHDG